MFPSCQLHKVQFIPKKVKTSAPLIKEHSQAISELFYKNLLEKHPEVKNIYNVSHILQPDGKIGPQVSRYPRTMKIVNGARPAPRTISSTLLLYVVILIYLIKL